MLICAQKVVTLEYVLKNRTGEVLDSSDGGEPLAYLHGAQQIVPGLERALEGLQAGDVRDVVVAAEDGYGEHDPSGVFAVPRSAFPSEMKLTVGDSFLGEDEEGHAVPVRLVEVRDDSVVVDANHPLAGEELHFHVSVREVRDATAEELEHGHGHGPGGHEHEDDEE
jgi:FKBP-type peptidyl-prolyl cis-trans isomerase SlyD